MAARILVVDDEPGMRLLGQMTFAERGIDVDVAASGPEALELCAGTRYGAVILDYKMPGMNGLETLRALRARGDETPAVLYSGYIAPAVAAEAVAAGARAIDKTETERLLAVVTSLVTPPT